MSAGCLARATRIGAEQAQQDPASLRCIPHLAAATAAVISASPPSFRRLPWLHLHVAVQVQVGNRAGGTGQVAGPQTGRAQASPLLCRRCSSCCPSLRTCSAPCRLGSGLLDSCADSAWLGAPSPASAPARTISKRVGGLSGGAAAGLLRAPGAQLSRYQAVLRPPPHSMPVVASPSAYSSSSDSSKSSSSSAMAATASREQQAGQQSQQQGESSRQYSDGAFPGVPQLDEEPT